MKFKLTCHECLQKFLEDDNKGYFEYGVIKEIVNSGQPLEFKCPNGHLSNWKIVTPQYETLFSIACNAILDGYYREAIASFTASIEMFYDFATKVLLDFNDIEKEVIDKQFKLIRLSERKYGAFTTLWLMTERKLYTELSNSQLAKNTELRNNVIHNGEIPTRKQAVDYGKHVIEILKPLDSILKGKYSISYKNVKFSRNDYYKKKDIVGKLNIMSPLSNILKKNQSLEEELITLEKANKFLGISDLDPDVQTVMKYESHD